MKVSGVDRVLAIGSGQGGVGKSAVSFNLAVALAREGRRVGLPDADIYGPSQPRRMGLTERPTAPFVRPHCRGESHVFVEGGGAAEAGRLGLPFLGA